MTGHDVYLLSPEISLVGLALLVMGLDLFVRRKGLLTLVAVVGLALPMALSIVLWMEVSSEADGRLVGVLGALTVDKFALFFKFLIVGVTGLVLTASIDYARRLPGLAGGVYRADPAFGDGDDASGLGGGADNHLRFTGTDGAATDSAFDLPDDATLGRGGVEIFGVERGEFGAAVVRDGAGVRVYGNNVPGGDWSGGGDADGRFYTLSAAWPFWWGSY